MHAPMRRAAVRRPCSALLLCAVRRDPRRAAAGRVALEAALRDAAPLTAARPRTASSRSPARSDRRPGASAASPASSPHRRARGPVRVLVGVAATARAGVAAALRRLGGRPRGVRRDRRAGRHRARRRGAGAALGRDPARGLRRARRQAAGGRRPVRHRRPDPGVGHQVHVGLRRGPGGGRDRSPRAAARAARSRWWTRAST